MTPCELLEEVLYGDFYLRSIVRQSPGEDLERHEPPGIDHHKAIIWGPQRSPEAARCIVLDDGQRSLLGAQIDARLGPFLVDDEPLYLARPGVMPDNQLLKGSSLLPAGASGAGAKVSNPDCLLEGIAGNLPAKPRAVHVGILAGEMGHGQPLIRRHGVGRGIADSPAPAELGLIHSGAGGLAGAGVSCSSCRVADQIAPIGAATDAFALGAAGGGARASTTTATASVIATLLGLTTGLTSDALTGLAEEGWPITNLEHLLTRIATGIAQTDRGASAEGLPGWADGRQRETGTTPPGAFVLGGARILVVTLGPVSRGNQDTLPGGGDAAPHVAFYRWLGRTGRDGRRVDGALMGKLVGVAKERAVAEVTILVASTIFVGKTLTDALAGEALPVQAEIAIGTWFAVVAIHGCSTTTTKPVALVCQGAGIAVIAGIARRAQSWQLRGHFHQLVPEVRGRIGNRINNLNRINDLRRTMQLRRRVAGTVGNRQLLPDAQVR